MKKLAAVGIIAVSLAFAALLFIGSESQKTVSTSKPTPPPFFGQLFSAQKTSSALTQDNSTQKIAQNIAEELIKLNPDGPTSLGNQRGISAIEPEKLAENILHDRIKNFDFASLNPEVKLSDLKIIRQPADKNLTANYLKSFQAVVKNSLNGLKISLANPTPRDFNLLTDAYQRIIAALYNLIVPEDMAGFHREQIRLLTLQKNIFANLANYESDPLTALVSLQLLKDSEQKLSALLKQTAAYVK